MSLSDLLPGSAAEGGRDEKRPPALPPPQHRGPRPLPSDNVQNPTWNASFAQCPYAPAALGQTQGEKKKNRGHQNVVLNSVCTGYNSRQAVWCIQHSTHGFLLRLFFFFTTITWATDTKLHRVLFSYSSKSTITGGIFEDDWYTLQKRGLLCRHFPELCGNTASHLHQSLLRQLRSLKGYMASHVGCDRISETVTRTGRSLKAI